MVRYPESALEYGIQFLKDCFRGVPDDVTKTVHVCCGFPFYLVSSSILSFNLTDKIMIVIITCRGKEELQPPLEAS